MTPRVKAWMRQAESDVAVAKLNAEQGFHSQACYHAGWQSTLNWASIWRRYSNFISRLLAV